MVRNHYVKEADAPTFELEVRSISVPGEVHGRFKRYGQQGVCVETGRGGCGLVPDDGWRLLMKSLFKKDVE